MSVDLSSTISIDADRDQVWAVLTDFDSYGEWSNFRSVQGAAVEGSTIRIRMPGMSFSATLTAVTPGSELQWAAQIITPRLFRGQHTFRLSTNPDGSTLLTNEEVFTGITVAPFKRLFERNQKDSGYTAFNDGLKHRVESLAGPAGA